jgi:hypothetical protein
MKFINYIKKVCYFSATRLSHSPSFFFTYIFSYFQKSYINDAKFYTQEETIEKIKQGKSIVRLGDGEGMLLCGLGIWYQDYDKNLEKDLRTLIAEYTEESEYILTMPEKYTNDTNAHLREITTDHFNALHAWLPMKIWYRKIFPKQVRYADTYIFYTQHFFNTIKPYLKTKKVIVITTQKNIDKQKPSLEKELDILDWVEAKAPNPYEWYHKYIEEIEKLISNTNIAKKDIVILMSAGPTSKPLARYFSMQGVQSIDMGHGFQYLGNLEELEKQVI